MLCECGGRLTKVIDVRVAVREPFGRITWRRRRCRECGAPETTFEMTEEQAYEHVGNPEDVPPRDGWGAELGVFTHRDPEGAVKDGRPKDGAKTASHSRPTRKAIVVGSGLGGVGDEGDGRRDRYRGITVVKEPWD